MGYSRVEAKEDVKACKTCAFFWHWSGETEYNFCAKWNDIIPSEKELNVCDRYINEKHKGVKHAVVKTTTHHYKGVMI